MVTRHKINIQIFFVYTNNQQVENEIKYTLFLIASKKKIKYLFICKTSTLKLQKTEEGNLRPPQWVHI